MRTLLDKYRKHMLALFGIVLMIAFIVPSTFKGGGGNRGNRVVGYTGNDAISGGELSQSERDWEMLIRRVVVRSPQDPERFVPAAAALLPASAVEAIQAHKEMFLLLSREAQQHGVLVTLQEVQSFLDNDQISVVGTNGVTMAFSDIEDVDYQDAVRHAVAQLLMITHSVDKTADVVKVSQPLRRQTMAQELDSADLTLAEIPASAYAANLPTPTPQQLDEQFKKYASVDPNNSDRSPDGFGYLYPDRIKMQAVIIPSSEVRAAAEQKRKKDAKSQYDWDRDAYIYYEAHLKNDSTSKPAATQPFEAVKSQARQAVLDDDIAKLEQRVEEAVEAKMSADFVAYRGAMVAGTDKAPASSVGPPYNTFEYLEELAKQTQKDFGVTLKIDSFEKEYLSLQQASAALAGLHSPMIMGTDPRQQPFPLVNYLFAYASGFSGGARDEARVINLYEPAPLARDLVDDSGVIVRMTAMQKSHAPTSLDEIRPQVEKDVELSMAFAKAREAAAPLIAQAKESKSLTTAANTAGRKTVQVTGVRFAGLLAGNPLLTPDELKIGDAAAQRSFLRQAFTLSQASTVSDPHPIGTIELARQGRLFVAQVNGVHSGESALSETGIVDETNRAQLARSAELARILLIDWFDYKDVVARMQYRSTETSSKHEDSSNNDNGQANQPLL